MASLLKALNSTLEVYHVVNEEWSYPQTKDRFMMQSPFPTLFLTFIYLLFVLKIGPAFMKNRKPFNINKILILYNIVQISYNLFVFLTAMYYIYIPMKYNLLCQEVEIGDSPFDQFVGKMTWVYFMNKILDLLDTVFFVLKKKTSQITFLHVYHHSGMLLIGYVGTKYVPGGHSILLGAINSFVHAVMYGYYLYSSFSKNVQSIWWKKHLTQLQLIQFIILIVHHSSALLTPRCNYPGFVSFMVVTQNMFALILFGDFYKKSYLKHSKQQ